MALVADAYTTCNVNVGTGPGTSYVKIGTLYEGTRVDLRSCESNWCNVRRYGLRSWISANYLSHYVGCPPAVVVAPEIVARPPNYLLLQ